MNRKLSLFLASVATAAVSLTAAPANAQTFCPIALTFDDGPGPYTSQIVDTLATHGAKATFFMVGAMVQSNPGVAQHVAASGNQVANHSLRHDQLTRKSADAAAADVREAQQIIAGTTGIMPTMMRPPYGETNDAIVATVGMPQIMWSDDTRDWATHNTESTYQSVTANAQCGDIVLMHDIHASTAAAVPRILDTLQATGFAMVTVEQLIGVPPPGRYYRQ